MFYSKEYPHVEAGTFTAQTQEVADALAEALSEVQVETLAFLEEHKQRKETED